MAKIVELTKENEKDYLGQIVELEQIALEAMRKEGRDGQLFATGEEDISAYVHSDENTVIVATDEKGKVEATTYITQGQRPFTYNDITKYFKYGERYQQYVKSQYSSQEDYEKDMLRMYTIKIKAFEYARKLILEEKPEKQDIHSYLQEEVNENGFHEKSELREKLNRYMSEYIEQNFGKEILRKYEQFYWITAVDILKQTGKQCNMDAGGVKEYESFAQAQLEYESILKEQALVIYENPEFEEETYYSANTDNSIELDTYITLPNNRAVGTARIIIFEGIKKHIERHFKNPDNNEIFLCSTLHRDNLPSKYVSEFFGLKDSLYVKRRQGRNREVHICKIPREQVMEYLTSISDKLAVLYDYNPSQKKISESTRLRVLQEQLNYENVEYNRLVSARATSQSFHGPNVKILAGKAQKVKRLKQEINGILEVNKGGEENDR